VKEQYKIVFFVCQIRVEPEYVWNENA